MARRGKPLKRLPKIIQRARFTWLKPGENERCGRSVPWRPFQFADSSIQHRLRRSLASLLTAHRLLLTLFLLSAFCLLPTAFSRNQVSQPTPSPSPSPAPSPSPSPTPPPNLHQWGAVTSFHGLPSDRTHAIAQTQYGVTWFATDGGLARYDGRRTNAMNAEDLPNGRVLALKTEDSGALWIGTDNGAARMWNGKFNVVPETAGIVINAIISPQPDRVILATDSGQIFDCQVKQNTASRVNPGEGTPGLSFVVRTLFNQPLQSA